MNKKILLFTLAIGIFAFTGCKDNDDDDNAVTPQSQEATAFHNEMSAAMMKMKNSMDTVTMTMDNDIDFARHMIPHHQGSIDMSNIVLKYGKDAKLLELANKFKTGDQESINRLNQFLSGHGAPVMSADHTEFMTKLDSAMMKMHESMMAFHKSSDPDYDFAETMTHHHQGAIDMSDLELHYGMDAGAKMEAEMIIDHQQGDIIELAKFKNEHGQPHSY